VDCTSELWGRESERAVRDDRGQRHAHRGGVDLCYQASMAIATPHDDGSRSQPALWSRIKPYQFSAWIKRSHRMRSKRSGTLRSRRK
jgi:hypothetical protein